MKKIIIKPEKITYEPGEPSVYVQGIKGRKNYEHSTKGELYNGVGGVRITNHSTVTIYGKIKDSDVGINIDKRSILDEFERDNFTEKLSRDLTSRLPEEIVLIENEYGRLEVSEESCRELYSNLHPRKAKKKYGNK